jgi:integrase
MLIKRGATWHTRLMFEGVLYQRSLHTRRKDEAIKLEGAFRTALIKGEFGIIDGSQAPTLAQFETRLLPHLKANVAPRTYDFYKHYLNALKKFPAMAVCRLHKIDQSLIEKFIQYRLKQDGVGRSVMTVNHSLRTLRRALILARDWKLVREVPKIKLLPGEHERDYVLTDAELKRMTDYVATAYPTSLMRLLLPFLVDTGLRISEACALQRDHVQMSTKPWSIKILKGKTKYAKREIPLTARAASCLDQAFKHSRSSYAWTTKGGRKPLGRHYPSQQFRVIRDAIGLPDDCVLHSTRHTFCTRLGNAGADAFTIQKLAGHSSIVISQRYVHSDREVKEQAIKLLDALNKPKPVVVSDTIEEI